MWDSPVDVLSLSDLEVWLWSDLLVQNWQKEMEGTERRRFGGEKS